MFSAPLDARLHRLWAFTEIFTKATGKVALESDNFGLLIFGTGRTENWTHDYFLKFPIVRYHNTTSWSTIRMPKFEILPPGCNPALCGSQAPWIQGKVLHNVPSLIANIFVLFLINKRNWILTYLLTYLLQGPESFLRSQLVCSPSKNSPHFTEPECSLPHSQAAAKCLNPGPAQSSPYTHIPPPGNPS